jgi:SpoVK/Ycf46/Vps4 family AAA+-type ATPase
VNFSRPAGTGKTSAADALAGLLGLKVLRVNYAELESRYVGDTPKNVREAFRQARQAGAVLFFDEADSILSRRFGSLTQANEAYLNQTRSVLMLELDAFEGAVVFATNLQRNYDAAFVRRIAFHVRFTLPDQDLRVRLWRRYLPETLPQSADVAAEHLAELSAGLSPADIAAAVRRAAVRAARRSGPERRVCLTDLRDVIDQIRLAGREVGSPPDGVALRVVDERVVAEEQVPPALRPQP